MSGTPNMKSISAVVPLRIASRQPSNAPRYASSGVISSAVGRISVSTQGSSDISSPMPLTRFWNRWLCVLIRPGTASLPLASMTRAARSGRGSACRTDPGDAPVQDADRGPVGDAVLLVADAAEERRTRW